MDTFQFKQRISATVIFLFFISIVNAQTKLPFDVLYCKYENTSSGIQNGGRGQEYFIEIQFNKKTEITFDSASANGISCKLLIYKNGKVVQKKKFNKREKVTLRYGYFRTKELVPNKQSSFFFTHKKNNLALEMNNCERIISLPRP